MTKILGLSGSLRAGSYNTMLMNEAIRAFGPDHYQLADLRLPLYDGDLESQGIPAEVTSLCEQIAWADALVLSSPEYNKGPSGVMKNALDWISRVRPMPTENKPTVVLSAANGISGGQRAKSHMYLYLIPFKVRLITDPEVNIGAASSKFDADGRMTDEAGQKFLGQLMGALKDAI